MSGEEEEGVERTARRLLHAYPWRVRTELGDEIVATVLDTLPPGAERLPWRDRIDLVRGGIRTRWGRRLPLGAHLRYFFGARIDDCWRQWVLDDLEAPGLRRRLALRSVLSSVAFLAFVGLGGDGSWPLAGVVVVVAAAVGVWRAPAQRIVIARRQGLLGPAAEVGDEWVLAPERAALPNLPVARLAVAVGVPGALAGLAAVVAAASPVPIPALDQPYHSAEPVGLGLLAATAIPPLVLGVGGGALLAVNAGLAARRLAAAPAERPVGHRGATTVAAVVTALVVAVVLGYVAVMVLARLLPWEAGTVGAAVAPASVGLLVAADRLRVAGRRRGMPIGLWDLVPRFAPRRRVMAIHAGTAALLPGAEPVPDAPGHPRG